MKKKAIFVIAMCALLVLAFAACTADSPSESTPSPEPTPPETIPLDEDDISDGADSMGEATVSTDDIIAQMAGNWIWYEFNPDNAFLVNLYADGSWESPGPLPTDMTLGGSFSIARVEGDVHYLSLILEYTSDHPGAAYWEIGSEFAEARVLRYDARAGILAMDMPTEGGGFETVWFTRV